jgi:hypothetical protein
MFLSGTTSTSTGSSTSACPIRLWSGLYTLSRIRPNLSILYSASRYDESVNCVHGSMWLNGFILSSFLHVFTCGTSVVSFDARTLSPASSRTGESLNILLASDISSTHW